MNNRKILILVGPSAVGKTTVSGELLALAPVFSFVRSVTTRPARGEADGEYIFLTKEAFAEAKSAGELLEYTEYATASYGTPKSEILRIFEEGKRPLLILDLAGARALKRGIYGKDVCVAYLYDGLPVMEARLLARAEALGIPKDATAKRIAQNRLDYGNLRTFAPDVDVFVKNKTPAETAGVIMSVFEGKYAQSPEERERILCELEAEAR